MRLTNLLVEKRVEEMTFQKLFGFSPFPLFQQLEINVNNLQQDKSLEPHRCYHKSLFKIKSYLPHRLSMPRDLNTLEPLP